MHNYATKNENSVVWKFQHKLEFKYKKEYINSVYIYIYTYIEISHSGELTYSLSK